MQCHQNVNGFGFWQMTERGRVAIAIRVARYRVNQSKIVPMTTINVCFTTVTVLSIEGLLLLSDRN